MIVTRKNHSSTKEQVHSWNRGTPKSSIYRLIFHYKPAILGGMSYDFFVIWSLPPNQSKVPQAPGEMYKPDSWGPVMGGIEYHVCRLFSPCRYGNTYIYTHTYIHTYVRTYVHTYIDHSYVHTYIGKRITSEHTLRRHFRTQPFWITSEHKITQLMETPTYTHTSDLLTGARLWKKNAIPKRLQHKKHPPMRIWLVSTMS